MKTNYINALLNHATDKLKDCSDSAALDAELLLCHILKKERCYLRAWPEKELDPLQIKAFQTLLTKRQQGQPIAYLIGVREFWSRDFYVTPDVLIPRPDTETLIEICLDLIKPNDTLKLIDLGTGSGIIAVTLAAERPQLQVSAVDISLAALKIAQKNAQYHHTPNINFIQSNWFNTIPIQGFDFIISNPPYIAKEDPHLSQGDLRFEPDNALSATQNGLADIISICQQSQAYLNTNAYLMIEHGYHQQEAVHHIFSQYHYHNIHCVHDLAGHPRVSYAQYQPI